MIVEELIFVEMHHRDINYPVGASIRGFPSMGTAKSNATRKFKCVALLLGSVKRDTKKIFILKAGHAAGTSDNGRITIQRERSDFTQRTR